MNYDQITGVLRAFAPAIVSWLVAKGIIHIPVESVDYIVAAVVAVGAALWSIFNNKTGKKIPKGVWPTTKKK